MASDTSAAMKIIGQIDRYPVYWAEPGRFTQPGVYYWDGTHNVHVQIPPAVPPQPTGEDAELVAVADGWLAHTYPDLSDVHEVHDLVTRLRNRVATLSAELEGARKALTRISEGDAPRPIAHVFRQDGVASKHDTCAHEITMYDECAECIAEFARATLASDHQPSKDEMK